PAYNNWSMFALTAAVLFVLFGSVRRRSPEEESKLAGLALAPSPLRLLAGLIDLLPIFVTVAALLARTGASDITELPLAPVLIAISVYFAHTFIAELALGRSIGKMVAGLRVVGTNGQPARPGAIVLRN